MLNKPLLSFNTSKLFANILRATQNIMRFKLQKFWCSVLYVTFRYFKLVYVTLHCFKFNRNLFQTKKKKRLTKIYVVLYSKPLVTILTQRDSQTLKEFQTPSWKRKEKKVNIYLFGVQNALNGSNRHCLQKLKFQGLF